MGVPKARRCAVRSPGGGL